MSTKKQGKYPKRRVITASDPEASQAFYAATDSLAPLSDRQLAAGRVQHPESGLYQIWLSTNGLDITCLAAYHDQERADRALEELKAFLRTPQVYDSDACATLFETLGSQGDSEPQPLPDDLVRQIGRSILRRVVDGPR